MEALDQIITQRMHQLGWPLEGFVDLVLAALAGGLVGLERELRGRQAGFRTHLLVAVGSALVMIVSNRLAMIGWPSTGSDQVAVTIDPGRIAYGVMTGVGFLGAGIIVQHKGNVRGLTTAAAVWCVAALGLACGLGLYLLALFATLLVVVALWALDHFEGYLPKLYYRDAVIRRPWVDGCIEDTVRRLKGAGLRVAEVSFKRTEDLRSVDVGVRIAYSDKSVPYELERRLSGDGTVQLLSLGEG